MSGNSKIKEVKAKVRPVLKWDSALEKPNLQGVAKIWVNKDAQILLTGGVESGKRCWVERTVPATDEDTTPIRRQALLASSSDKNIGQNVVMMTEAFREACGFKLGDQVSIRAHEDPEVPPAEIVEVEPLEPIEGEPETTAWKGAVWHMLKRAGHVFPGLALEPVASTHKKKFVVKSVNSGGDTVARHAHTVTTIRIRNPSSDDTEVDAELEQQEQRPERLRLSEIPGLAEAELKAINDLFTYFNVPPLFEAPARSCGIVIHGMRKSGKTFILEKIADTNWGRVFRLEPNAKSSEIDEIFEQARAAKPSIVLIDNLHNLVSKDRPNSGLIVQRLCKQLDQLSAEAKVSKGTFQVLVVASCLDYKSDVPMDLQGSTRFDANITLAIPDAAGRRRILEAVCADVIITERDAALSWLAEDTHAFNTGDLCSLMNTAIAVATRRVDDIRLSGGIVEDVPPVILSDLQTAFRTTRPSAMHDVTLKPPTIHWRDIGGQEEVKKALQRQIAITKSTDTKLKKVMLHPPKGILLYGPPGCSKTLSAQAVATESGFNFFAVKGAELLNMYVGESERAIRNLFERARSASPSIIFFDEIDSIGSQRASGAGAGAARSQGSVNVLTTLLTEMDGFEPLTGVLVLAATNRPEVIDTALLRPGRFDRWIYVGLPDLAAREAIIKMNMDRLLTAPDLDIPDLARRTEGFSGAELTQICSKSTERVADAWLDGEIAKDELMIDMRDVIGAIESTPRAVSQDMLDDYDEFAKRLLR